MDSGAHAADNFSRQKKNNQGQPAQKPAQIPTASIPIAGVNLLLGRPTDNSITVNVLSDKDREIFFEYGTAQGSYYGKTATTSLSGMAPAEIVIGTPQPNTQYYYRIGYKTPAEIQIIQIQVKIYNIMYIYNDRHRRHRDD